MNPTNNHINYIELQAIDLKEIKTFYSSVFNWQFTDYGAAYIAFSNSGLEGGFAKTEKPIVSGALIVLYHSNLNEVKKKVETSKGTISKDIFSFPGGHRFHFTDPSGNELAVWSDQFTNNATE